MVRAVSWRIRCRWVASVLVAFVLAMVWGCSSGSDDEAADGQRAHAPGASQRDSAPGELRNPAEIPLPKAQTGILRVYTVPPGFVVLVDNEPVRAVDGEMLRTPCAVTLLRGPHQITVARAGWRDAFQQVSVEAESDMLFESLAEAPEAAADGEAAASVASVLFSAYLDLEPGTPVPLLTLNSPGRELDPYVEPGGATIWFVGERDEGRGLYVATRPSPFHFFDAPVFVPQTRSSDLPATPSATADPQSVYYAVTDKPRIYELSRPNPLAEWGEKEPLAISRPTPTLSWDSAQILPDGLRLYWTERATNTGEVAGFAAVRRSRSERFRKAIPYPLPGLHPCLSSDGLRQYVFDGRLLKRARRPDLSSDFAEPELVATLDLPNYRPSKTRRQYWVSDDQQWLYYCDDPERAGDLYMVRFSKGRGWGFIPRGESIPDRQPVAANEPPPVAPVETEPAPPPKKVDPLQLPLPYATLREQFTKLLAERKYAEAEALLKAAAANSQFDSDRKPLAWDVDDLAHLRGFWKDVRDAAAALKPGNQFRIGNAKLAFIRFEDDTLVGKTSTKEIAKPLGELEPPDLADLFDRVVAKDDAAGQLRIGTFLHYDPSGNNRSARARFDRAGEKGREFYERLAGRLSHQAQREFDRGKVADGLAFAARLQEQWPDSAAAAKAAALEERAYALTKWRPVGSRKWDASTPGEYAADAGRADGSLLISERTYQDFELRLQWKAVGRTGQGGVFFQYDGRGRPYSNALKIHLGNDAGIAPDLYSTGALFGVEGPDANAVKPEGQWNDLRMRVEDGEVQVWINGRKVLDAPAMDPDNTDIPSRGYVALEGTPGGITYRRTLLVELAAPR
ncbi:MAG: DUF1080 domain-containing protein [Planctomycetes bacterium]|nr:DUF1080 domain-containing protein [Planctomycetota bacterium]